MNRKSSPRASTVHILAGAFLGLTFAVFTPAHAGDDTRVEAAVPGEPTAAPGASTDAGANLDIDAT